MCVHVHMRMQCSGDMNTVCVHVGVFVHSRIKKRSFFGNFLTEWYFRESYAYHSPCVACVCENTLALTSIAHMH